MEIQYFTYTGRGSMNDDVKKGAASYNRAFTTLNEKAESYRNKTDGITVSARCVGSDPSTTASTPDTTKMYKDTTNTYMTTYGWNGLFKVADTKYTTDTDKMNSLGIINTGEVYWLASRLVYTDSGYNFFNMRYVGSIGEVNRYWLFRVYSGGGSAVSPSCGTRPVFKLADGVKIIRGSGTSESPYELGL